MTQRNYRDPIHNIISLDESRPDDRLIVELIDTAEFQRLRRIRQLGLALFTYQGAEHSRFTHSIGVMHLMTRALDLLAPQTTISPEARAVGRAAALLHDLGHGPFSHLIEKVFRFKHEDWTARIILEQSHGGTEVNQVLRKFDPELPDKIASVYGHTYTPAFVGQLVSSQLDCDRMDYLLRDSLMTGVKYGVYDLEWVLHALMVDPTTDRIYVAGKGLHAVEEYLQARYYMFRQVYFHRTLRSAEAVLVSALTRARQMLEEDRLETIPGDPVFEMMLTGADVSTAEYLELDDTNLLFRLKRWSKSADPILADLSARFIHRKLFKALDADIPEPDREAFWDSAREIVQRAGFDPNYYLIMDRASDVPYYGYYLSGVGDAKGEIYVETRNGSTIREIGEVSEPIRSMRAYSIDRVCFPAELSDQIQSLMMRFEPHEATVRTT